MKKRNIFLIVFAALIFSGCNFINSFDEDEDDVKSISFDTNSMEMSVGEMDILNLMIDSSSGQNNVSVEWSYDEEIISGKADNYSIVITALKEGTTTLQAKCDGKTATCALRILKEGTVSKVENPYVYCSSDFVNVTPGETQKVFASLYGGTNTDIDGFSFSSDKPSVASLYVEGNYCWITGMNEGLAKITARHSKSSFSYSFLVNCSGSPVDVPYITTSNNIVTINRSSETSKKIKVDLKNPLYTTYKDDFLYEVVDENGSTMSNPPIEITYSGNECTITALSGRNCYIKVSHPSCTYDMNILCRIVENIDSVYIEPSSSFIIVNGKNSETLDVNLSGVSDGTSIDLDKFEWSFSDGAEQFIEYTIHGGSESGKGNSLWITGKKNGSVKITVTHPLSSQSRNIIVNVRNTETDASSSKVYITTTQNYVETKIGQSDIELNITLTNISSGEENNLEWTVENSAADGSSDAVIMFSTPNGISSVKSNARSATLVESAFGKAYITPLKEGSAVITITHPKAAYSAKILVNVSSAESTKVIPLSIKAESSMRMIKNGESDELSVLLTNAADGDESSLKWTCSDSNFTLSPNGKTCTVTSNASSLTKATVFVTSDKAKYPAIFSIIGYNEDEGIGELKSIYADKTVYTVFADESVNVELSGIGFSESEKIVWKAKNTDIVIVNDVNTVFSDGTFKSVAVIKGLKAGTSEVTATVEGFDESVTFYIEVKQVGIIDEDKPCYLSTSQNVVTLNLSSTEDISVQPYNIQEDEYTKIVWKNNNPELFSISSNGKSATITPVAEGSGTITVSHPLSKNELTINVHIGNEYVYKNTDVAYISTESDTLLIKTDSKDVMFYAVLAHTESELTETNGFNFSSEDESVFTVNYNANNNYCIITPKKAGQAILKISHDKAEFSKEVVVIIEKSLDELADIPYLSTSQNVVSVIQGEYTTVSASLSNSTDYDASKWKWTSQNGSISDVITNNGTTAMISGVTPGTTKLVVSHSSCVNQLEIIVICLDSNVVSANPYIQTDTNIINIKTGGSKTISSQMVGGTQADLSAFLYTVSDSSIAFINGTGSACYIKGLKSGCTYITVRNANYPNAYAKTVLVRIEDTTDEDCYIKVPESIIKLSPKDTDGKQITATLANGDALDAQDFVWWADDYSIVSLTSVTDTVAIVPTGVSGTTYVHVKHPKVLDDLDILVICSEYDEFSFPSTSTTVLEKSISFLNMQVPVSGSDTWIEYESSNSDVCVATGSNKVCMIAGVKKGTAKIKATLKNASGTIADSELAVIIEEKSEDLNTISIDSSIINMNVGESQTLETVLSGDSITSTDVYNIKWSVDEVNGESGVISLLATEQNETKGKNAYITAKKAGTAVLNIEHPKCRYPLTVYIIVPEKEVSTVTLSQTYIEMYKSDGSVSVTAKVLNGTSDDESNITWTAPKVGGLNIVSISKNTGKTCNIMPRNTGSTTLRAQLSNGNYADCVVTVLANAQIKLDTATLHVNPGYSETVNYTVTPESASITWQEMMNGSSSFGTVSDYFDFEVNTSAKTITVTGKEIGNGYLYGYFASDNGTGEAKLEIKCEYTYELEFENQGTSRTMPKNGTVEAYEFHVYPHDLQIEAKSNCDYLEIVSYSLNEETGKGTVYVKPLTEGKGGSITLTATNPKDLVNTPIERTHYVNSYYDQLHIEPIFDIGERQFSSYSNLNLELSDGESVNFYLKVQEENANVSNIKVTYSSKDNDSVDSGILTKSLKTKYASDNTEKIKQNHIVISGNGNDGTFGEESTTPDGTSIFSIGHNYDYVTTNDSIYVTKHFKDNMSPSWNTKLSGETWGCWTGWFRQTDSRIDVTVIYNNNKMKEPLKVTCSNHEHNDTKWSNNDLTYDMNNFQQKYKEKILCGEAAKLISIPYVIKKDKFMDTHEYFYLNERVRTKFYYYEFAQIRMYDIYTYPIINSQYNNENPELINENRIIHPWYVGLTESKDYDKIATFDGKTVGGSGTISIMYDTINGTQRCSDINVNVVVRNCRKNTKGYWQKDGNTQSWKLVDPQGLNEIEKKYQSGDNDNYAYFDSNNVTVFTGEESSVELKSNISSPSVTCTSEDSSICTCSYSGNKLVIKGLNPGETNITGTINSMSFSISVNVNNKLLLLELESSDDSDDTETSYTKDLSITVGNSGSASVSHTIYSNYEGLDFSKVKMSSSNGIVDATNDNGKLTFATKSKHIVETDTDENGNTVITNEYDKVIKGTDVIKVTHPDCPDDFALTFNVTVN